jgi:hypothetical protein
MIESVFSTVFTGIFSVFTAVTAKFVFTDVGRRDLEMITDIAPKSGVRNCNKSTCVYKYRISLSG